MIYIVNSGIVLANDQPALKHVHLMQPAIRALSDTEYLILLKHGTALESMDSRLAQMRSSDAGKTWQEEGFLEQTVQKDEPVYSYFCPHLTLLRDGRLLVLSVRFRRDDPNLRCYNPETGGCLRPDTTFFVSQDRGRTWSGPHLIPIGGRYVYSGGPIVEQRDGRWMATFETWKEFSDPAPIRTRLFALFSSDQGKTWADETTICEDDRGEKLFWDVVYTQLSHGPVIGTAWTHDVKAGEDLAHHHIVSMDNGRTWSLPTPMNRQGQFNVSVELPDGRLLGVYNVRNVKRPGIYAALSHDAGRTWDIGHQIQVWDARGQAKLGAAQGSSALDDLATFAFGKPDAHLVDDRHVAVAFWAMQSCMTQIRWCMLSVKG